MTLTFETADAIVDQASKPGREVYWDGWTICIFRPRRSAYTSPHGVFRTGRWGLVSRIPVSADGTWGVPNDFVT
jgi:hypothetical protein